MACCPSFSADPSWHRRRPVLAPGWSSETRMKTLLLVLLALALPLAGRGPVLADKGKPADDPVVRGKALSAWTRDLLGKDAAARAAALVAFKELGPRARPAVPALLDALRGKDFALHHPASLALTSI